MEKEKLHFRIGLSGTYWDKKPQYTVLVNDTQVAAGSVTGASDEVEYIEFDHEFDSNGNDAVSNLLKIRLENKEDSDVVKDNYETQDFKIIKDMLLNIHSIEIDDINIDHLIYKESRYFLDNPIEINGEKREYLENCVNLGINGTYTLTFGVPFYIWLLDKL